MSDRAIEIRDVEALDLDWIESLNRGAVPNVNELSAADVAWFAEHAAYFRVGREGERRLGFLIALTPEIEYASPNFNWFKRRRQSFVYIDRIVVAEAARGRRVGWALYDDLRRFTVGRAPILACEVNLRPRNEASLRFHARFGFRRVGAQQTEGGAKEVALMEKTISG